MKLYELKEQYLAWLAEVEAADGELSDELISKLDCIQDTAEDKLEAYAIIAKQALAEATMIRAEEVKLAERRKRAERLVGRMEELLADTMAFFGRESFRSPRCQVSFRKSTRVELINEKRIPKLYKVREVVVKVSKDLIRRAIAEGMSVPGAQIIECRNIQIK